MNGPKVWGLMRFHDQHHVSCTPELLLWVRTAEASTPALVSSAASVRSRRQGC